MNMPMDMTPIQTAPPKMETERPEAAESLQQSSQMHKDTGKPNAAFDLVLAGLLSAMGLSQQLPGPETSADVQVEAGTTQAQALCPDQGMGPAVVAAAEGAGPDALQGPMSRQGEEEKKLLSAASEGPSLHSRMQQPKGNGDPAEAFPLPEPEGETGHAVREFTPVETLKDLAKEQQTPGTTPLQADEQRDKAGIQIKASALQELQKTNQESTPQENPDNGFRKTEDVMTMISDNDQFRDPGVAAIAGKAESPHMQAEPAAIASSDKMQASSETMHVAGNKFIITRHDGTSIEISLQPEGLGKLDIELVLEKGTLHAQIHTSHEAARELVEQNIGEVMNALAREGITIGGFSVSLKQGGNADPKDMQYGPRKEGEGEPDSLKPAPVRQAGIGNTISIFV